MNTAQKGRSDLKLASLRRDRDLIELARAAATEIIGNDPTLKSHNEIRDEIDLLLTPDEEEFLKSFCLKTKSFYSPSGASTRSQRSRQSLHR